jgi:predicted nucleic acid-binding protein
MIVLDTNVVSELMRPLPSDQVVGWTRSRAGAELFTTAITVAEIFYGIERLPRGKRRAAFEAAAEAILTDEFAGRVIGFDSHAARAFAKIAARRRAMGKPISQSDAQIAAIVQVCGATLATRNLPDFQECDIRLVDPWVE